MLEECTQGPLRDSSLEGDGGPESLPLPLELADTGELIPLSLDERRPIDPMESLEGSMSSSTNTGKSSSTGPDTGLARGRGIGPCTTGIGRWYAGRGTDGRVCLGCLREGKGPSTRRRGLGGGRRGMFLDLTNTVFCGRSRVW